MSVLALILATGAAQIAAAPAEGATVTVTVTGLRNERGLVRACLTFDARTFPDCNKDPHALTQSVSAAGHVVLVFRHVPQGDFAVAMFHDENGNDRFDRVLGIPSEGFGFSRDAPIKLGPPRFDAARLTVGSTDQAITVRMRYVL